MARSKATSDKALEFTPQTMLLNSKTVAREPFYAITGTKQPLSSPPPKRPFGAQNPFVGQLGQLDMSFLCVPSSSFPRK